MKLYAHIQDGAVRELIPLDDKLVPGEDVFTAAFAAGMVDVTALAPQPSPGWTYDGKAFAPPVAPPVDLRAYAASARYAKETASITVGTAQIATDRDSQAMITGMWAAAHINPNISVSFKSGSGFVTVGADQIAKIAAAVANHVQACFTAEAQVVADIAAGTVKTTADVDAAFAAVTA